ncbi:hypothetical protein [Xanthomonas citri]|uniref:hypothetical protein n=1 Tax=Xanthomonas citri TaxID=346 RepID=UPI0019D6E11B|nr:hypothetical protein [Xanthomonas citri]
MRVDASSGRIDQTIIKLEGFSMLTRELARAVVGVIYLICVVSITACSPSNAPSAEADGTKSPAKNQASKKPEYELQKDLEMPSTAKETLNNPS